MYPIIYTIIITYTKATGDILIEITGECREVRIENIA